MRLWRNRSEDEPDSQTGAETFPENHKWDFLFYPLGSRDQIHLWSQIDHIPDALRTGDQADQG